MSLLQSRRTRRGSVPGRPLVRKDLLEMTRLAVCECEGECPICRDSYQIGKSIIRVLPCEHSAHHQCIDLWFTKTSQVRCPLCMQTFAAAGNSNVSIASSFSEDSATSYSSVGLSVSSPNLLDRFQRGELLTTCGESTNIILAPVLEKVNSGESDFLKAAMDAAANLEAEAVKEIEKENSRSMFGPPSVFSRPLPPRFPWLKKN